MDVSISSLFLLTLPLSINTMKEGSKARLNRSSKIGNKALKSSRDKFILLFFDLLVMI